MSSFLSPIKIDNLFWQCFQDNLTCQYSLYSANTSRAFISCYLPAEKTHFFHIRWFTPRVTLIFLFTRNEFIWSVFFQRFLIYILISLADACASFLIEHIFTFHFLFCGEPSFEARIFSSSLLYRLLFWIVTVTRITKRERERERGRRDGFRILYITSLSVIL